MLQAVRNRYGGVFLAGGELPVEAALAADPLLPIKLEDYMDGPDDYEIFMANGTISEP